MSLLGAVDAQTLVDAIGLGAVYALMAVGIGLVFVVVLALTRALEWAVFRPLRTASPAVMLVTTFAVAFLLQSIARILDVRDGTIGEAAASIGGLRQVVSVGGVDVRRVTIVAIAVAAVSLGLLA